MINWIKVEDKSPESDTTYLISDGEVVDFGIIQRGGGWYIYDRDPYDYFTVTHYASINLPEEGTTE